jgi:hypothetical protein
VVAGELHGEIKLHVLCRPVLLWTMGARSEVEWDTAVTFVAGGLFVLGASNFRSPTRRAGLACQSFAVSVRRLSVMFERPIFSILRNGGRRGQASRIPRRSLEVNDTRKRQADPTAYVAAWSPRIDRETGSSCVAI